MWIVKLDPNANGAHNNHKGDHITSVPDGWAMIPDGFAVPDTFPFVSITAQEMTHKRSVVIGKAPMKEITFTVMTVTAMTAGNVPPAPIPVPTQLDQIEAQVAYTAMMTDTLLEA